MGQSYVQSLIQCVPVLLPWLPPLKVGMLIGLDDPLGCTSLGRVPHPHQAFDSERHFVETQRCLPEIPYFDMDPVVLADLFESVFHWRRLQPVQESPEL